MPDLPSFSIVIPTLNEAARIETLLRALQQQKDATNFEILVCDGGSDDETAAIASRFEGVRVLGCERGVSKQRNAGARAAQGELLFFLDADDVPGPTFIEKVAASYRRVPFAVACPWFVAIDGSWLTKICYFGFNFGFFLGQSTLRMGSGVCLICSRDKFLACGGFDAEMHLGEDIQLIRKLCPRFGVHRHLMIPLGTSGRRFEHIGALRLMWFYARITPFLLLGWWKPLQKMRYDASPYEKSS